MSVWYFYSRIQTTVIEIDETDLLDRDKNIGYFIF